MADYNESTIAGTKWQRCWNVQIFNRLDTTPIIVFMEEVVASLGNGEFMSKEVNDRLATLFDPNAVVPVYDPTTLQPTGATFTHAQLYGMLFSAYIDAAKKRDNPVPM